MSDKIIENYIVQKRLDSSIAVRLRSLEATDLLTEFILLLQPSANTLRRLLEIAEEIAQRDKLSPAVVLFAEEVMGIARQKGARKERLKLVWEFLEKLRYPLMHRIQAELDEAITKIAKEFNLKLHLPKDLEGTRLTAMIAFHSPEELRKQGEALSKLADHPGLENICKILRGELHEC